MGIVSKVARKITKKLTKKDEEAFKELKQKKIDREASEARLKIGQTAKRRKGVNKEFSRMIDKLEDHHYGGREMSKEKYDILKNKARDMRKRLAIDLDENALTLLKSNYEDTVKFNKGGDTPKKKTKPKDAIGVMVAIGKVKKGSKPEMSYGGSIGTKKHNYAGGGSVTNNLKSVPTGNKGLGKLPKSVRNTMGYMKKGGMVKGR